MKPKPEPLLFPSASKAEVEARLPKTTAILLRMNVHDKQAINKAAKSVHLTATEYLIKCHEIISEKLLENDLK